MNSKKASIPRRRPGRTCLFFDPHAVYALPPWHAMGINPPLFRRQAWSPATRRERTLQPGRSAGADSEAGTSPLYRDQSLAFSVGTTTRTVSKDGKTLTLVSKVAAPACHIRSEEHTSELQSQSNLVCR